MNEPPGHLSSLDCIVLNYDALSLILLLFSHKKTLI